MGRSTTALDFFGIDRLRAGDSASIVCAGTPAQGELPGEPTGPRPLGACSRGGESGRAFGLARWRKIPRGARAEAYDGPEEQLGGGRVGALSNAVVPATPPKSAACRMAVPLPLSSRRRLTSHGRPGSVTAVSEPRCSRRRKASSMDGLPRNRPVV